MGGGFGCAEIAGWLGGFVEAAAVSGRSFVAAARCVAAAVGRDAEIAVSVDEVGARAVGSAVCAAGVAASWSATV